MIRKLTIEMHSNGWVLYTDSTVAASSLFLRSEQEKMLELVKRFTEIADHELIQMAGDNGSRYESGRH